MKEPVKVGAILDSISTRKDKSLKIVFESQEMGSEQASNLFAMRDCAGWLLFAPYEMEQIVVPTETPPEFKNDKTCSQRLRAVLFVLWEQCGKVGLFDDFYKAKMEKFISMVKEKLEV